MIKIALVEDNADNRLLVRAMLEDRFAIVEYRNGGEALAGIGKEAPAVVLLDISLPDMDGREVLRTLRGDPALKGLPVVALTAHAMAGDREALLRAGFDDYVAKPIDEGLLVAALERLGRGKAL